MRCYNPPMSHRIHSLLALVLLAFAGLAHADGVPDPYEASRWTGTWSMTMTASYSTCDDVQVGDARKVRWTFKYTKAGFSATETGGAKGDAADYTGTMSYTVPATIRFRHGRAAGADLYLADGDVVGRWVVVRTVAKNACVAIYDVRGVRPAAAKAITGIGISECDEFIAKVSRCIDYPTFPAESRDDVRDGVAQAIDDWRQKAAGSPKDRAAVVASCKTVLDGLEQKLASMCPGAF